jgi:hypothetical protein
VVSTASSLVRPQWDGSVTAGTRRRAGVAALCGLFLATYLLLASPLNHLVPTARSAAFFVPAVIGLGVMLAGRAFALVLAADKHRVVRASVAATILIAIALCAALRMKSLWWPGGTAVSGKMDVRILPTALLDTAAAGASRSARPAAHGRPGLEIGCMVTIEESIKLLPVFLLIRRRRIRTAGEAMWSAALGGMGFGMIEAVNHSFFLYARLSSPATTYLVRALVMAPSHGIGAAIACGVAFASAQWRNSAADAMPARRDLLAGFLVAAMMHAAHNGLQAACGPSAQIATVFLPIVLLYGLSQGIARERVLAPARVIVADPAGSA